MAHFDATLVKQILDVSQRQRKPDVQHHRQADDLRAGLEGLEGIAFRHPETLSSPLPRSKPSSSDSAPARAAQFASDRDLTIATDCIDCGQKTVSSFTEPEPGHLLGLPDKAGCAQ
jgi:hypothetical protein